MTTLAMTKWIPSKLTHSIQCENVKSKSAEQNRFSLILDKLERRSGKYLVLIEISKMELSTDFVS